jgi:REP element-mobilizing transposase RayT
LQEHQQSTNHIFIRSGVSVWLRSKAVALRLDYQEHCNGGILPPKTAAAIVTVASCQREPRRQDAADTISNGEELSMTERTIPFRGFDERGDVRVYYHGILPHWRQDGCTYFVTYRQADALPQNVLRELEHERNQWLRQRNIDTDNPDWHDQFLRLSNQDQRAYERLLGTRLNDYLDAGHGTCSLRRPEIAKVVAESLIHFHGERVLTGDYVVMPNHVHVLMRPLPGYELEGILQSIKSFTATKINRILGAEGRFWMRESYDHIVRDYEQLEAYQEYIRANPKKAGLKATEYFCQRAEYRPEC